MIWSMESLHWSYNSGNGEVVIADDVLATVQLKKQLMN